MSLPESVVAELRAALRSIAPSSVQVGVMAISDVHEADLKPTELDLIVTAVPRRRREFASGRALLRSLLDSDEAVLSLTSRAPAVPDGVAVSLAHDAQVVIAAVGSVTAVSSLGVDVECIGAVADSDADGHGGGGGGDGMVAIVRRDDEMHLDPTMVFVAKEAAYKAWSNSGGRLLDHHEVRIVCSSEGFPRPFVAEIGGAPGGGDGVSVHGAVTCTSTRWLALVALDAPR